MLRRAWFRSYKLLGDVSLELGRLNVIVGRNGVGKSTVLDGIDALLKLIVRPNPASEDTLARSVGEVFSERGSVSGSLAKVGRKYFELETSRSPDNVVVTFRGPTPPQLTTTVPPPAGAKMTVINRLESGDGFPSPHYLRLLASSISARHQAGEHPTLGPDGTGIATVIQYLQGTRDGTIEKIEADLRRIVPNARRLRALPANLRKLEQVHVRVDGQDSLVDRWVDVTGARWELEMDGLGWIPAEQLSEGTLLATALITVLHHQSPQLLLIDDIDKGLHPVAQKDAIKVLRAVLEANPELQIIATSHSPFVLDELDASEVFVAGAISPTETAIRRLDSHPAWEQRKEYLHPGEFWSLIGEGWVGGTP